MSSISYSDAKRLVLARLRQTMAEMPVAERTRPRYILNFKPYSVLDLIREVEMDTAVGRAWVYEEAKRMNYIVE